MTEIEAIEWQKSFKKTYKGFPKDVDVACDMAINALEKQEKIKEVFTHYPFMGIEISALNDCVSALSEIKTILKE